MLVKGGTGRNNTGTDASIFLDNHADGMAGQGLDPGPRLNIKTVLSTYGDFHVKDKTAVRTSYL